MRESNGTESERIALEERTCYNGVVQHIIIFQTPPYIRNASRSSAASLNSVSSLLRAVAIATSSP